MSHRSKCFGVNFKAFLGVLWRFGGALEVLLGTLGALLGLSWGALGVIWGAFGALLEHSCSMLGVFGRSWVLLGRSWGVFGLSVVALEAPLRLSWELLGHTWGSLGAAGNKRVIKVAFKAEAKDALSVPPLGQV